MEKKKLLLVAVSVGVVLLTILIIPLLIISPRKDFGSSLPEQTAVIEPPNLTQGWDIDRETARQSGYNKPDEIVNIPENPPSAVEPTKVTTISIPAPRTAAVPEVVVIPDRRNAKARPVAEAPKEVTQQAAKPAAKPAAAKPAAAQAEKPKTAKTFDNSNFWIQTGAFSTIKYAERAKDYLAARGIKSIIEDPVINGKTWYRVRVGPYTTRDEANYWLALVKSIDGFSASQVWETN